MAQISISDVQNMFNNQNNELGERMGQLSSQMETSTNGIMDNSDINARSTVNSINKTIKKYAIGFGVGLGLLATTGGIAWYSIDNKLGKNTVAINDLTTATQTHSQQIGSLTSAVTDMAGTINTQTGKFTNLEKTINNTNGQLDSLKTKVSGLGKKIDTEAGNTRSLIAGVNRETSRLKESMTKELEKVKEDTNKIKDFVIPKKAPTLIPASTKVFEGTLNLDGKGPVEKISYNSIRNRYKIESGSDVRYLPAKKLLAEALAPFGDSTRIAKGYKDNISRETGYAIFREQMQTEGRDVNAPVNLVAILAQQTGFSNEDVLASAVANMSLDKVKAKADLEGNLDTVNAKQGTKRSVLSVIGEAFFHPIKTTLNGGVEGYITNPKFDKTIDKVMDNVKGYWNKKEGITANDIALATQYATNTFDGMLSNTVKYKK